MQKQHKNFGIDIDTDEFGEPIITGNGDLLVTQSGLDTVNNDIEHRLYLQKGELLDKPFIGVDWEAYDNASDDPLNKNRLTRELNQQSNKDGRVQQANVTFLTIENDKADYSVVFTPIDTGEILEIIDAREIT